MYRIGHAALFPVFPVNWACGLGLALEGGEQGKGRF
ncbi:hypothetical protein POX_f07980 [Penicillium oxalicum]|uniref:Uncharacterized protein n=1 Tax=Penicillium oxalicum (strain 114-2 / CGMCC 5302) TaxID=933388 RepID=S8B370_PENO1|nr:hypothetical protein POX_f07980 [Penicillium oxalicum]EPS28907.1 hypothetical protein PDE_03853 [Penicillium oxalicum 114-2]KAI2787607.1 hypothetical protein POX_f07980 [Penicillium oxalicum]